MGDRVHAPRLSINPIWHSTLAFMRTNVSFQDKDEITFLHRMYTSLRRPTLILHYRRLIKADPAWHPKPEFKALTKYVVLELIRCCGNLGTVK